MQRLKFKHFKENKDSFAYGMNLYKLSWIFIIGGIFGYIVEMLWAFAKNGYFESRQGIIHFTFIPVYAFGALIVTLCLYKFQNARAIVIFLVSAIVGGAFEFICSLFQEHVLGTISWEYSESAFNLQGRTNLFFSLMWGILGLIFIRSTYPFFSRQIEKIPNKIGKPLTWVIMIFLCLDMSLSSCAVKRQSDRHKGIQAQNPFAVFLDERYDDDYLKKIYPNMIIVK